MVFYLLLLIPLLLAIAACKTNRYIFKSLQTISCLLIIGVLGAINALDAVWALVAAFLMSVIGDYFLSFKEKKSIFFMYGIAFYFLAHIGYLLYINMNFEFNIMVFVVSFGLLLMGYLFYFTIALNKRISGGMKITVLFYLIISCVALALAISINTKLGLKVLTIVGIALIVISDTIIAETEFMGHKKAASWTLPTYYAAQILLSASVIYQILDT